MSIYVTSDVHGNLYRLKKLLEYVNFSEKDKLYIIGDVLDGGDEVAELIDFIMDKNNIELILGNHEDMFMEAYNIIFYM